MEAAGLAASIITFIEAGVKVFHCYSQIRASTRRTTTTNEHIEITTLDLKAATQRLREADPSRSDDVLYTLAQNCEKVSTELLHVLDGLHPSTRGRFRAFLMSVKVYWYDDDVRRLDSLLVSYRQQLGLRLQLLMLDQRSTWRNEMDDMRQIGKQYSNPYSYHLDDVESELRSVVGSICSDGTRTLNGLEGCQGMSPTSGFRFREKLQEFYVLAQLVSKQNRVLRKLYFNSLQLREDDIQTPAAGTFEWLVEGVEARGVDTGTPNEVQRDRVSCKLLDFLRLSRRILFISGKAGCGKSTMMKFLNGNTQVTRALRTWAGDRKLVFVKMFFWRADDLFLKSRRGFYRAMLFHILRQCPEFVDALFPSEEESFVDAVEFPMEELVQAVRRLGKLQDGSGGGTHCFCYFIDGLDEYEGDVTEQKVLAQQLVDWSSAAEVKIVCSSRPNPIFQDAFDRIGTVVNLHEVTAHDIECFTKDRFNTILDKTEYSAARDACVGLVDVIVERAEGIFLWASLVVRSLLNACLLHEEPSRLREILDDSPTDLNDFFSKILQRMDPSPWAQRRSIALLYMTLRNPYTDPLNALAVSWLNELNWLTDPAFHDTEFPLDRAPRGYSDTDIDARLASAKILLQVCTQGLVELREQEDATCPSFFRYRLEFFHRSVREFLDEEWLPKVQATSRPALPLPLQEVEFFSRLRCAEVKFCPRDHQDPAGTSSNVRYSLESTFYWLSRLAVKKAMSPPLKCLQDLEHMIHGEAAQIQLAGREFVSMQSRGPLKAFLGHLKIEKERSWRWHDGMYDGCSFLHWAAYWGQRDYVTHRLCGIERHVRAAEGRELNLLLSAAVATDSVLCRYLLSRGWSFDDRVEITTTPPGEMGHAAMKDGGVQIWLVILRDFAFNHLAFVKSRRENIASPEYLDAGWMQRWAAVIEVFLNAGATPRVEFLLDFGRSGRIMAASLEMMLEVLKTTNWSSLLRFFEENPHDCGHAKSSPAAETAEIRNSDLLPPHALPHEPCTTQMLLQDSWGVVGVQEAGSTSSGLFGTFQARVF